VITHMHTLKTLFWFWLIDEPIGLTLCRSVIMRYVGPSSSDGARWQPSDGDGQKMAIKCSNL
jgi:hypothetical protein